MNSAHHSACLFFRGRTILMLAAATSVIWPLGTTAVAQGGSCPVPPSTEVVLDHRLTMLWPAGSPLEMGDPDAGVHRVDSSGDRASYRFTAPEDQAVQSVWIHVRKSTLPPGGLLRVSLKADVNGLPFPVGTIPSQGVFQPATGWQQVSFAQTVALTACEAYHVVIEPQTPTVFSPSQYVELLTIVSRYPLAYQAEDPSTSEFRSFFDLDLAFMYEEPPDPLLSQWIDGGLPLRPFFALQCTDGTLFGQPYDKHSEPHVMENFLWGQRISIASTVTVDHAAVFVREEPDGLDKLQAEIWNPALPSSPIAKAIVLGNRPSIADRNHWFGGVFRETQQGPAVEVQLAPGTYYLMLRSVPVDGPVTGFYVSMVDSSLPVPLGNLDPTYGAVTSHAIFSPNGGASFFAVPGMPDMAFILSNLSDPEDSAYGIYDEGNVKHKDVGETDALTASPGEELRFNMVMRNIGPVQARLVYDFVDFDTGQSLFMGGALQDTRVTLSNRDAPGDSDARENDFFVPSGLGPGDLWRVLMRVGHRHGLTGPFVIDDEVLWEIRIQ